MSIKIRLFCIALSASVLLNSQTQQPVNTCGTGAPSQQWEEWFQTQIDGYLEKHQSSKQIINHTIPVIVHVIHFGEVVGTFPNVDSNQIKSQIVVLNDDFAGTGLNANTVPSYFAGLKSNTGIRFCLARKDQQDVVLNERGIDRVNAAANSWQSPATPTLNLKDYLKTVIIPATIWDPTKYLNIWISDKPANYPLNGFATYPSGSGLSGMFGGDFGNATNDGVWIYTNAFGTVGSVAPTDKGRTATHEIGHYLGLRHIWGDGNCLSDYVGDTPYSKAAHFGCVPVPTPPDQCGINSAPNGEMPMNFMDRSDEPCMYMFTHGQTVRMHTALSQSPYRNLLGTHDKCEVSPTPATAPVFASFNVLEQQCLNKVFYPTNTSGGYPYPTYNWSSSPAANIIPNPSVPSPGFVFTNPGSYTITLVATNSVSSSTYTRIVSAFSECPIESACIDTIRIIRNSDTLHSYKMPNNPSIGGCGTGFAGYLSGTNCYKDKEFAQYFPPTSYTSTNFPQVNSVIVLFDSVGTVASSGSVQIACKLYGGTPSQGPVGFITQKTESMSTIVQTPKVLSVEYVGKPGLQPYTNTKIIPFKFDFATPVQINSQGGFFASVQGPVNSPLDSINIFSNSRYRIAPDSSAWYLQFSNNWKPFKTSRSANINLAIIPQITCGPAVGINDIQSDLQKNSLIVPNPGTGLFNLIFTLKKEQELSLRVYNTMGQEILSGKLSHVLNNVVNIDLTDQANGIYFAEISGGQEKVVKKIVLSH